MCRVFQMVYESVVIIRAESAYYGISRAARIDEAAGGENVSHIVYDALHNGRTEHRAADDAESVDELLSERCVVEQVFEEGDEFNLSLIGFSLKVYIIVIVISVERVKRVVFLCEEVGQRCFR